MKSATDVHKRSTVYFPDWTGDTVVVVAGGPSAADVALDMGIGRARFIATNKSWRLAPWADMLFAVDWRFWKAFGGVPEFNGMKVTSDHYCQHKHWGVFALKSPRVNNDVLCNNWPTIAWGGNSGMGALNIAHHLGAAKIIMVGFDMNDTSHWHPPHDEPELTNPIQQNVDRWRRVVDAAAPRFRARVINCSPRSALKAYEKMSFAEALTCE